MPERRRRRWSFEDKLEICAQARLPENTVALVARRYALNANLLFKWLRDDRFSGDPDVAVSGFLPISVRPDAPPLPSEVISEGIAPASAGLVIELPGGHRVVAPGDYDPDRLGRLLQVLSS